MKNKKSKLNNIFMFKQYKINILVCILASLFMIFSFNLPVCKAEFKVNNLNFSDFVPKTSFYSFKQIFEKVGDFFTFQTADKIVRDLKISANRLKEIDYFYQEGKFEKAKLATTDYIERVKRLNINLKKVDMNEKINENVTWINENIKEQKDNLTQIMKDSPHYLKDIIDNANLNFEILSGEWNNYKLSFIDKVNGVWNNVKNYKEIDQEIEKEILDKL